MDRMNQEAENGVRDDYKRQIVDMVGRVEDIWILEQIIKFIKNMTKVD